MEERLINAVANHPELYDASSFLYQDRNKKDLAWRKICEEIRQPEDICRRKWKSLRDTYIKEKRMEKEKRSGSAAGSGRRWKFFAVMGFLDPFLTPQTSGNMVGTVKNIPPPPRTRDSPKRQQSPSQKSQLILQQSHPLLLLLAPQSLAPPLLLLHPQAHRGGQLRGGRGTGPRTVHRR
ncbi:transcription factor Adf-1-like [Oreochromis aureus]|uniref:transcription factor Adf-1-like n=1 Tax=Oreochromis aureus TaxID=47969 RepID=UPI001954AEDD|nr:transcription factor Adf-1-like [Oreochromis aureus]